MNKYLSIPTELIKSGELTHTEIFLFIEICNLAELERGCIASNNHFAEIFGMTAKSVSNIISSLSKKGFIKTEIEKGSRNQIRRIFTIHNLGNSYPQNMDRVSTKYGESKEKKLVEETSNKKNTKKDSDSDLKPVDLIKFYRENISSKISKIREPKSVRAIVDKKSDIELIFAGLKNYSIQAKEEDEQFIKNLLSFVEQDIYLDFQEEPILKTITRKRNPNGTGKDTFDLSGIDYGTDEDEF